MISVKIFTLAGFELVSAVPQVDVMSTVPVPQMIGNHKRDI
jgi:hypothetical protein